MHIKYLLGQNFKSTVKMLRNPAGERNKQPILDAIKKYMNEDTEGCLLEISSGKF